MSRNIRKVARPKAHCALPLYPEPEPLIPENSPTDLGEISPVRSFQSFTPSFDEIFDWLWGNFSALDQSQIKSCSKLDP